MKNLLIIALLLITSVLTAQNIDSTQTDFNDGNVARSMNVVTYGNELMEFRKEFDLSVITMAAWIGSVHEDVTEIKTSYSLLHYLHIERGEVYTPSAVQIEVYKMLKAYRFIYSD
jgi:hypothetical protein